jgi:rfaE bifunctional protein nucleotidyltransferase chain/domain
VPKLEMVTRVTTREDALRLREEYRHAGKRVGFTSGVFDILHAGHVEYLAQAAELVDVLIVGVNSDSSVRTNKGEHRPIVSEALRAEVVAGLRSVSHAFVFAEHNNNVNIELLKPDLYIKAGDYSADKLTSKHIVESYGGRVEIIPFRDGLSSTSIIDTIVTASRTSSGPVAQPKKAPAVFVDRDGTINEHIEYLSDPKKFVEIPRSFAALKRLQDNGYRIIIVTNQPGIGLGYFSREDFFAVNREMMRQAAAAGCGIDKIYFCPHSKAENCECRKPEPFFIKRAERELSVDVPNSFVIGDMTSDIQLGKNAGCRSILVQTGRGGDDGMFDGKADFTAKDLFAAAEWIEQQSPVPREAGLSVAHREEAPDAAADFNNIFGSILGCVSLITQRVGTEALGEGVLDSLDVLKKAANKGLEFSKRLGGLLRAGDGSENRHSLKRCIESVVDLLSSSHGESCHLTSECSHDVGVEMADSAVVHILVQVCEGYLESMSRSMRRSLKLSVDIIELSQESKAAPYKPGRYARVTIADGGGAQQDSPAVGVSSELSVSLDTARTVIEGHGGSLATSIERERLKEIALYLPMVKE